MRAVEVAVGYQGGRWEPVWVNIEETRDYWLEDKELREKAEAIVSELLEGTDKQVSFITTIFIESPDIDA